MCWGMLDKVGNIDYVEVYEGYLGNIGGFLVLVVIKELIEQEVCDLIEQGYQDVYCILIEKIEEFECLVKGLLEYEMLIGEDIGKVICNELLGGDDFMLGLFILLVILILCVGINVVLVDVVFQL